MSKAGDSDHPTILVVQSDRTSRNVLIRILQQEGYLVLEAQDAVEAFEIAIRHSRNIHLLLASNSDYSRTMTATLKPYRPSMDVMYFSTDLDLILKEVSKVLSPPAEASDDGQLSWGKVRALLPSNRIRKRSGTSISLRPPKKRLTRLRDF